MQKIFDPLVITLLFNLIVLDQAHEDIQDVYFSSLIFSLSLLILPRTKLYFSCRNKSLIKVLQDLINAWLFFLGCIFIIFFVLKVGIYFSRFDTLTWSFYVFSYLFFNHIVVRKLLRIYRIKGGNSKNIIFCGSQYEFEIFNKNLILNPWLGLKVIAWFTFSKIDIEYKNRSIYKGDLNKIKNFILINKADEIVFTFDNSTKFEGVLDLLGDTTIPISYFPCWASLDMKFHSDKIGDKFLIKLWGHNINSISLLLKRFFDVAISFLLLVILLPFLIFISLIIKLNSKGPILFKQLRSGIDGKSFYIYKFRTMIHSNSSEDKVIRQATKFDQRITKVGRILRKWSIDELPQLINVINGDMSLIGPRPHAVQHNDYYRKYIRGYMQRHYFKPGITGLAQINGLRGETKDIKLMEKRIQNDLTYINNWSFLLDLEILIKTSYKFMSKRAY